MNKLCEDYIITSVLFFVTAFIVYIFLNIPNDPITLPMLAQKSGWFSNNLGILSKYIAGLMLVTGFIFPVYFMIKTPIDGNPSDLARFGDRILWGYVALGAFNLIVLRIAVFFDI